MTPMQLKHLADQLTCHPVSRSIHEIEAAGEAINDLARQREELIDLIDSAARTLDRDGDEYGLAADFRKAIARIEQSSQFETQAGLPLTDEQQASAPAIVFFPYGSLGEAVEEGGAA